MRKIIIAIIALITAMRKEVTMGKTSWEVKAKYNKKAYIRFTSDIKSDLFNRIDAYCKENNLSRSQFLTLAIENIRNSH